MRDAEHAPRRHLAQLPGEVPGPAVERAADLGEPAARALAERAAPVAARVLEGAQLAVVASHDEDREVPDAVLVEVAGLGDVVERARELPDPRPQSLVLEPRELGGHIAGGRDGDWPLTESSRFPSGAGNHRVCEGAATTSTSTAAHNVRTLRPVQLPGGNKCGNASARAW